eukprot:UN23228
MFHGSRRKKNGMGCFPLLGFLNSTKINESFVIVIADCCREEVEDVVSESKGTDQAPRYGSLQIYTCEAGEQAYGAKHGKSKLSQNIEKNSSKLFSEYNGDVEKYLRDCAAETDGAQSIYEGKTPRQGLCIDGKMEKNKPNPKRKLSRARASLEKIDPEFGRFFIE